MGNGAGGLQRRGRCLELFHSRPRPFSGLPLGRGWLGGGLRRQATALLRLGIVEWEGPDPERTAVWADQQRRQSRRRREGVLLLSRQYADPLVHEVPVQVSPGCVSLRRPGRDEQTTYAPRARI